MGTSKNGSHDDYVAPHAARDSQFLYRLGLFSYPRAKDHDVFLSHGMLTFPWNVREHPFVFDGTRVRVLVLAPSFLALFHQIKVYDSG